MDTTTTSATTLPAADQSPADAAADRGPALLRPLRLRDFRLVFTGESISLIGDQFHFVALAWLTLQLTGSGLALGTVLMIAAVPRAVFMLVGGALSDRFSPRNLMLVSNALRAVVVGIVAALVLTGQAQLWHLFVLAAIFGVVDAIFHPALNTIVPMLVPGRLLPPANALVQVMAQLSGLIGPAVAGIVVAAMQTGPAFVVDAASFAVAAGALVLVRGGRRVPAASHPTQAAVAAESLLQTIRSGLAFAWNDPPVRALLILNVAFNFAFTGPVSVGLPYLADTRFEGGSIALGVMLSAFGAGAVIGAVLAGSLRHVPRLGLVVLLVAMALGVGQALVGVAPNVWVALPIGAGIGLGVGFLNVRVIAWLQVRTPEHLRGRVMSLIMLSGVGLAPFSLAISGAIIDLGAVTAVFAIAGAIIVLAAVGGLLSGIPRLMTDEAST
ncbi:MAG TPA: MFS transporter [Candidatus Limnocylindria bacterium]